MMQGAEYLRLKSRSDNKGWKKWGPYLSERQWGTVREDYSENGDAWGFVTHHMARSKAYRWGEEGLGGISDNKGRICFAPAFWNHHDPFLKERLFGLTGADSNHGEDVKELYWYEDSSPTHSYMRMRYKYPTGAFPYEKLATESRKRSRQEPEYELLDTGIFDKDEYFDIVIEYAKADEDDVYIKISATNRSKVAAPLTILPTIWFRNTWAWGYENFDYKPMLTGIGNKFIEASHRDLGHYKLYAEEAQGLLFCDNETNYKRLYNFETATPYFKDGINDFIVNQKEQGINTNHIGTKAAAHFQKIVAPGDTWTVRLRLVNHSASEPFGGFEDIFEKRIRETDTFYEQLMKDITDPELRLIQRQCYAGMLWTKQFYYYNVNEWIKGDPAMPNPNSHRKFGRNSTWRHMYAANIISMPDKWEYPWFAAWDLAFHCLPLARVDSAFAKRQLEILLREYYMHPNGQLPAYEWSFSDVNPPVHAWATWKVYEIDREMNGKGDIYFLEKIFHKLLLNFTWWVNLKDAEGNNIFGGGFLGMDNIGVFDRSAHLPTGGHLEQADGTGWMAMYTLNMLRIACEIAIQRPVYQDMASKFFEHFLSIAGAMQAFGDDGTSLWDEADQFYYDILKTKGGATPLKIRSMVGLIPLFAVEVLSSELLDKLPTFKRRVDWVLNNRRDLSKLVSRWTDSGNHEGRLLAILRGHRMKMILKRMLDENEFLSEYGIRSLSKYHKANPYEFRVNGDVFRVDYAPAESTGSMFGGNSNWRGPIWFPVNYLIIDSLLKFNSYYGDDFEIEYPTNSGETFSMKEIAMSLSDRLISMFRKDKKGNRPIFEKYQKLQSDPHFENLLFFPEYFDGDTGKGLGAMHQTGWTGLVSELILNVSKAPNVPKNSQPQSEVTSV
jgi:Glycosyl hydrolase family 63 C-terminal domain